jgi:hypothetical protein
MPQTDVRSNCSHDTMQHLASSRCVQSAVSWRPVQDKHSEAIAEATLHLCLTSMLMQLHVCLESPLDLWVQFHAFEV